jgi:hypothetical protein
MSACEVLHISQRAIFGLNEQFLDELCVLMTHGLVSPVVGIELGRLSIGVREKNGRALHAPALRITSP